MFDKPYYTCVLWSRSAQHPYIFVTDDPGESFREHNRGRYKKTASYRPWELVHTKEFGDHADARKWKEHLKALGTEQDLFKLIGFDPAKFKT